jgi:hypothetical protein
MRIRVLSDLHLEHHDPPDGLGAGPSPDADVVVLAGDIGRGTEGLEWARRTFPAVPVLLVAGNHEAYDRHLDATIAALRAASDPVPPASQPLEGRTGTYFLHRDAVRIGDVRVLGCTFWTQFGLFPGRRAAAMRACRGQMGDYERIHLLRARRSLRPRDTDRRHRGAARFLRREATRPSSARATVVVTHHAPSPRSIDPRYEDDLTSAAFVARRPALIRHTAPAAWIHGHVHVSFDYRIGPTRVVANPRGHPDENPSFDPGFTIEV